MIVLKLPDQREVELSNDDARRLAELLWEMAGQKPTAFVAVAIHDLLRQHDQWRRPIEVPVSSIERVHAALAQLY